MALTPAITDLEQLKSHPALAKLLGWKQNAVTEAKFDRDELTIWIERDFIRDACAILREDADCPFNYLCDITCVDWYPAELRFEVVYHLLSLREKERVRLKVRLGGDDPTVQSAFSVGLQPITSSAKFLICSEFDSRVIRICERILMPDDWEGHPLRKDYPVEGYR